MRNYLAGSIVVVAAMLAFSTVGSAQTSQGSAAGAKEGPGHVGTNVPSATPNLPFDAHDFSGVWMTVRTGGGGIRNRCEHPLADDALGAGQIRRRETGSRATRTAPG